MALIKPLKGKKISEFILSVVLKSVFVGSLYGIGQYMKYIRKGFGRYDDLLSLTMQEAYQNTMGKRRFDLSNWCLKRMLGIVLHFCAIDNAYHVRLSEFMREYTKIAIDRNIGNIQAKIREKFK